MARAGIMTKPSGQNLWDIQHSNRSLIVRLIRQGGFVSRVELARQSGLKQATITYIINSFLEKGIVREAGLMPGTEGRRVKGLCLNTDDFRVFAVRIVSTYYLAGIFDLAGNCLRVEKRFFEPVMPVTEMLERLEAELSAYCEDIAGKTLLGIGIAVPLSTSKLNDGSMMAGKFPKDFHRQFEEKFNTPVLVENDAKLAAYARWNVDMGMDKGVKGTLVSILVSQTLSCGIVINGLIHMGAGNLAGDIGHMSVDMNGPPCECGRRGCLEQYIAVPAIKRMLKENIAAYPGTTLTPDCDIRDTIAAYQTEDPLSVFLYDGVANYLGYAISNLINLLAPDRVTIGDEVPRTEVFMEKVRQAVRGRVSEKAYAQTVLELTTKERRRDKDVPMMGASMLASVMALDNLV